MEQSRISRIPDHHSQVAAWHRSGLNRDHYFFFTVEVIDWMTIEATLKASS
jgi:hypothetical protein